MGSALDELGLWIKHLIFILDLDFFSHEMRQLV